MLGADVARWIAVRGISEPPRPVFDTALLTEKLCVAQMVTQRKRKKSKNVVGR